MSNDPQATTAASGAAPDATGSHQPAETVVRPSGTSHPAIPVGPELVPGYELVKELGRGGMGVVYKANQVALKRTVALKMILGTAAPEPGDVARFLAEAEAIAEIDHPNVVRVYEFGRHGDRPYFAMEYLDGGALTGYIRGERRLEPHAAAELVAQVAAGVQAAHDRGIVHRDLKPANILLVNEGGRISHGSDSSHRISSSQRTGDYTRPTVVPKVTDFGLAKRGTGADLTNTNAVMGTPAYMAPEQAAGRTKFVGPAADIYALGVVLFECLTGRVPFVASDTVALIRMVVDDEPPPVRRFAPAVPRDLELICLKCLAKAPHERYPTAAALADDLMRFVRGEPVTVRAPTRGERLVKWAKRKPTLAAAYALTAALVASAAVAGGAVWLWQRAAAARDTAERERIAAEDARHVADGLRADADRARGAAEGARGEAEDARQRATDALGREQQAKTGEQAARTRAEDAAAQEKQARLREVQAREELAYLNYTRSVDLAHREYQDGNVAFARELLRDGRADLRGWEWNHVSRLCSATARQLNLRHGGYGAAFSADGNRVVIAGLAGVASWDLVANKATVYDEVDPGLGVPELIALRADGNWVLADADDTKVAKVWVGPKPTRPTLRTKAIPSRLSAAALSPSATHLFGGCENGTVHLWDAATGQSAATANEFNKDTVTAAAATAQYAVAAAGRKVVLWTLPALTKSRAWDDLPEPVTAVAVVPGPLGVVAVGDRTGTIRLLSNTARKVLAGHRGPVTALAFTADGKRLVSGGADGAVRVWDADRYYLDEAIRPLASLLAHSAEVRGLAVAPDGQRAVSTSADGTARLWDLRPSAWPTSSVSRPGYGGLAVTPDRTRVAARVATDGINVFDPTDWKKLATVPNSKELGDVFDLRPDGQAIAVGGKDGVVRVLAVGTGQVMDELPPHAKPVTRVLFDPTGKLLASGADDGTVRVYDLSERRAVRYVAVHKFGVLALAWSADSTRVVSGSADQTAAELTLADGKSLRLTGLTGRVVSVACSAAGDVVALADEDGKAWVWNPRKKGGMIAVNGTGAGMTAVTFSPDGKRLVTGARDGSVWVWDARTGRAVLSLPRHTYRVETVAFTPDGHRLMTADGMHTVNWYDGAPRPVAPKLEVAPPPRPR